MPSRPFEIRGTLETSYPDVFTPEALAALVALAPLDADRKAIMKARIARRLGAAVAEVDVLIPLARSELVALFRREGFLVREDYRPDGARLHGHLPHRLLNTFRRAGKVHVVKESVVGPVDRAWAELDGAVV